MKLGIRTGQIIAAALAGAASFFVAGESSAAVQYFTNPTAVNLLEKWNPNGTYGLVTTQSSAVPVSNTERFNDVGQSGSWRFSPGNNNVVARFTFDQPRTINKIFTGWRNGAESAFNYTWSDQNGVFVSNSSSPSGVGSAGVGTTDNFAPRTSNYIEITSTPVSGTVTPNGTWDVNRIGAYLAPGNALRIDGTYNVFYQEDGTLGTVSGSTLVDMDDRLTDHKYNNNGPSGPAAVTWHFSQDYQFMSGALSHLNPANTLFQAKVEASNDGVNWTTVFGPTDFLGTNQMLFTSNPWASWARLSWNASGSGGGAELGEFQIFVFVPEPGSMTLLGMGAFGLLAFRRRRSIA